MLHYGFYHGLLKKTLKFLIPSKGKILTLNSSADSFPKNAKYDYIFLNGVLGKSTDIMKLLLSLHSIVKSSSRVLVYQHNHLWQGALNVAERLGLKKKEGIHNWLSVNDVSAYLKAAGFEVTRIFRKNLFPLELFVKSLPIVCRQQEILFVEGHSTDGTREEIKRVMKKYPRKNVRVVSQPGKGQGDAIRVGFKKAKSDIIILYEGD